jgi:putative sugar O-methyltransferase
MLINYFDICRYNQTNTNKMIKNLINKIKWRIKLYTQYLQHISPNEKEKKAIHLLRQANEQLPIEISSHEQWNIFQKTLKDYIANKNPLNFLQWDVIRMTMFYGDTNTHEIDTLLMDNKIIDKKLLTEDSVGNPTPYYLYLSSSTNLIHHLYSLQKLLTHTSIRLNELQYVVEFGGGYGSFCRLTYRAGFQGQYTIFDLPLFSHLQHFYLSLLPENFTINIGKVNKAAQINLQHNEYDNSNVKKPNLFVALWSLSETPLEIRKKFLEQIGNPSYILIGYQHNFFLLDNTAFFAEFQQARANYRWQTIKIPHLPNDYYLIGEKIA